VCVAPLPVAGVASGGGGDGRTREAAGERRLGVRGWTKKKLRVAFLGENGNSQNWTT